MLIRSSIPMQVKPYLRYVEIKEPNQHDWSLYPFNIPAVNDMENIDLFFLLNDIHLFHLYNFHNIFRVFAYLYYLLYYFCWI